MIIRSARVILAASAALFALASCSVVPVTATATGTEAGTGTADPAAAQAGTGHALKKVHDPGNVTGTLHGHCSYRDHGRLPDPRCTPGSIDPAVTQANIRSTICRTGYTKTVRPPETQTEHFKFDVAYPDYGTPPSEQTELDHLVSLELGGSNDATNLWPEYPQTPNPKDKVENALNQAVCDGRVSLSAAQQAIASDWLTAESKLGLTTSGAPSTTAPSTTAPAATSGKARCTVSASYDAKYGDYDVHVHSNQPNRTVKAEASNGASHTYHTDSSGSAVVYLKAKTGDAIHVTVGAASCSTGT